MKYIAHNCIHMTRVAWMSLRVALLHELQYRAHLALQLVQTAVSLVMACGSLAVVYSHGSSLNGWNANELLLLVAMFMMVQGVVGAVIQPSLKLLMNQVRQGTLDFALLKPADSQFIVSVQRIDPWKLVDVLAGLALLVVAIMRIPGVPTAVGIAQFAVLAGAGMVCLYSAWIALATLVFWFVRAGELLDIARCTFEAGRWPVGLYPTWLKAGVTFIVPVGFAISLPVSSLTDGVSWQWTMASIGYACVATAVSRTAWRVSVRHYSGASA